MVHAAWKEFYSPVDILNLNRNGLSVRHIVVLIDDIYDMFRRLEQEHHLYDRKIMEPTEELILGLSALPSRPSRSLGVLWERIFRGYRGRQNRMTESRRVRVQSVELALEELLAWRRTEMVYAESVARSLKCDLTVLGTKHTQASVELLIHETEVPRCTYPIVSVNRDERSTPTDLSQIQRPPGARSPPK